jgi:type II secretory pathway pseudopilin PulG
MVLPLTRVTPRSGSPRTPRAGFTVLELLVVLGVIMALFAAGFPLLRSVQAKGRRAATAAVVQAVAAAIADHRGTTLTIVDGGRTRIHPLWDVNGDGLVDGDPALEAALPDAVSYPPGIAVTGYRGLLLTAHPNLPKRHVDAASQRILDAWRRPLRIRSARKIYGGDGFGIWSPGADGRDDGETRHDDIRSWETYED